MSRFSSLRSLAICRALATALVGQMLLAVLAAHPAAAQKQVALVIGNGAYTHAAALANPGNDASDFAEALKAVGIEAILGLNLDKRGFDAKVREFSRALANADTGLLFYAGHGLQVGQRNYLIPIDSQLQSERDLEFETVSLDFVMRQMEIDRDGKTNIIILDACRDNPLARNLARAMGTRSAGVGRGLAEVRSGVGTFVAYSTNPGNVAQDGDGRNSPFAAALIKALRTPARSITAIMTEVRKDVIAATGGKQVPWDHSALTGEYYFQLAAAPGTLATPPVVPKADNDAVQSRIKQLEEELKRKADPQLTVKLVELSHLKERLRQLEEAARQDQKEIFEVYNRRPANDASSRANLSFEIGAIQRRMAERGSQQRKLRDDISKLEAEVAPATSAEAAK